jgi:CopG family nickel-responsive transcriptional regulator
MPHLVRFGVSLEKELLTRLDQFVKEANLNNRSQVLRSLIRENMVKQEWLKEKEVAGAITLVYDHTKRALSKKLTSIQHSFHGVIISMQHIHLDHDNCFEIVAVKGKPGMVQKLFLSLRFTKGVKHSSISMATTGSEIP